MKRIGTLIALVLAVLATIWTTRALLSRSLPDLQPWHRPVLESEYRARDYPNGITFSEYRQLESKLAAEIRARIGDPLDPAHRSITNRYFDGSPAHPGAWPSDWNLSYERVPTDPRGGIVLLHGASDSPYSMRALAEAFVEAGLYVIAARMPGNGTIPGELTTVRPEDWTTVPPMAVAHARQQIGDGKPVYLGGYSAGASVALNYALDAFEDEQLQQVDGIFMFSPAAGLTGFAAFARWDYWVSKLPGFEKFAWVSVRPEYEPFKYTSFAKQAGHLVYVIASGNQSRLDSLKSTDRWRDFPPVITFQSVVDGTVSVPAVLDLHQALPSGRSQLVLFDVNRNSIYSPFLRNDGSDVLRRMAEEDWSGVDVTIVRNQKADDRSVVANRRCSDSAGCPALTPLESQWPRNVFSLSHVAIPFPPDDPLYG
ncbi:MAG: alpha/beta hydrolase, partial [Gammaproteobacteria bacterium]